jgi:hypothetical protein
VVLRREPASSDRRGINHVLAKYGRPTVAVTNA